MDAARRGCLHAAVIMGRTQRFMLARRRQHFRGQAGNIRNVIRLPRQRIVMFGCPGGDETPAARVIAFNPLTRDGFFNEGKGSSSGHGDIARLFSAKLFRQRRTRHLQATGNHAAIAR